MKSLPQNEPGLTRMNLKGVLLSPMFHIFLIIILGLTVYSNIFHVPFVFDDQNNIIENIRIKSLLNIPSLFTDIQGPPIAARPLTSATFALNYYLGGLNPFGYHFVNLALHIVNGLLLYYFIRLTARLIRYEDDRKTKLIALFSSVLFITHPIQTESVTYIVSRSVLLSSTFFLLGILLFDKAVTSEKKKILYTAALFLTSFLGMASREEFFLFPFVLILYDFFFVSKNKIKDVLSHYESYIPVFLTLSYLLFIVMNYDYKEHAGFEVKAVTPIEYLLTQLNVHWTYLRLLILPISQNLDYDYPIAGTIFGFPTIISFAGYIGLWVTGIYTHKRSPVISFCILWFMITLAPSSSIIPVKDVIFEHRLYLPAIGFFVTVAILFISANKPRHRWLQLDNAITSLLILIIIVLSCVTHLRNSVWDSEVKLWEDVVRKSPGKGGAHTNLGHAYLSQGSVNMALNQFQIAAQLKPDLADAYINLGLAYYSQGLIDQAIEFYLIALKLDPDSPTVHNDLGAAYDSEGLTNKAIEHYQIALRLKPDFAEAYVNLGIVNFSQGLIDKAIECYQTALILNPDSVEAHYNLGVSYDSKDLTEKAIEHFTKSLMLKPDFAKAHYFLGVEYRKKGLLDKAEEHFNIADSLLQTGTP